MDIDLVATQTTGLPSMSARTTVSYCWLCGTPVPAKEAKWRPMYDINTGNQMSAISLHSPCLDKLNFFLAGYRLHAIAQHMKSLESWR